MYLLLFILALKYSQMTENHSSCIRFSDRQIWGYCYSYSII